MGMNVQKTTLERYLKNGVGALKKPCYEQLAKYSEENVKYYFSFLVWLKDTT